MTLSGNASSLLSILSVLSASSSSSKTIFTFLQLIQTQVQFSTILVLNDEKNIFDDSVNYLSVPLIRLTTSKRYQIKQLFKDDILAVVFITMFTYHEVLNALEEDLHQIAQTKIMFVCSGMENNIREVFEICWSKKMINAIAFLEGTYFGYNPFPQMILEEHSVHENHEVFPNRMLNLYGYPLRIVLDELEPRDFVYTNRKGEDLIGGYSGHLVASLAEKLNATLLTPIDNRNEVFHHTNYDALLASDVIDIFAGLAFLIPSTRGQSYPAEVIGWCLMLPVEPNLPQYLYYPMIFGSLPILLMFAMVIVFSFTINCFILIEHQTVLSFWRMFLNEDSLRALLGQSFSGCEQLSMKLRMIYFLSCFMGLFFNTWYLATLNTLVTSPPSESKISSLDDIRHSPIKILMFHGEYADIRKTTDEFEKYLDIFQFTHDNTWYHATRDSLNRSFAYPVPTNKWKIFEEQQSLYKAPIFRNSDICIVPVSLMVFLLHENSIFTKELNEMILRTHQSGLYEHWVKNAFLELVEGGRIKLNPQSEEEGPQPLTLEDMKWIWGLFGVMAAVDCGVFVVEIVLIRLRTRIVIEM